MAATASIATGILALGAGNLPTEAHEGRVEAIAMFFESPVALGLYFVGELGWLVGLLAAVVALYSGGSPRLPLVLLVLSGFVLVVFDHPAPYGPIVFGSFFVGALWLELTRGRRSVAQAPPPHVMVYPLSSVHNDERFFAVGATVLGKEGWPWWKRWA